MSAWPGVVSAQRPASEDSIQPAGEIEPADVLVEVKQLQAELELIRLEIGRPVVPDLKVDVRNAAPRVVLYLAQSLFGKADRLAFESTGRRVELPSPPTHVAQPADVREVVIAALARVDAVKTELKITEKPDQTRREPQTTHSDVLREILRANRSLNGLLERPYSPCDVFQQVTLAISYSSRLLEPFGELAPPDPPEYERRKRPRDVFQRLADCQSHLRAIAEPVGIDTVELIVAEDQLDRIDPADVYDKITLLVANMAYVHSQLKNARPPIKPYYPGRKIPSDVFQRAGILESQLKRLQAHTSQKPDWLTTHGKERSAGTR
jgi:hypothetical protein